MTIGLLGSFEMVQKVAIASGSLHPMFVKLSMEYIKVSSGNVRAKDTITKSLTQAIESILFVSKHECAVRSHARGISLLYWIVQSIAAGTTLTVKAGVGLNTS